jgi:integrase/recombinase XerD
MVDLEEAPSGLAQRILSETQVMSMIDREPNRRNKVMLKLLYQSGVRVSELVGLCWSHLIERDSESGWLHILGKGFKTREILLVGNIWQELLSLRGNSPEPEVFLSRQKHGNGSRRLDRQRIQDIVRAAALRAGIDKDVSPHFLRHSCASHALERGASIALVQQTLGHASLATTSRYTHVRPGVSISDYLPK